LIERAASSLSREIAATAELPVASIGSTKTTSTLCEIVGQL